ncbi:MAG: glycoside hydrolase family 43 protein [Bacteroidales bacterium]|nr:glycoside hydrolase family 43 protein [Bacteroidales bacterium]
MTKRLLLIVVIASIISCKENRPHELLQIEITNTLKFCNDYHNPLLDHQYTADPTSIEYNGRLYVYGTNDQQQCDEMGQDCDNTYEHINTLAMMSTTDMVNWTYHGLIPTKQLSPWIIASWAPSICCRVEDDGKTHFYIYYSNSGYGTGVLTSTSPVGPWTSPLEKSIVDANTPGLGDCTVPFDPGVVIDNDGTGWLAFGAGKARIARLSKDMISFDSPFCVIPAPYHFEANELNIIGDKLVYLYNLDWTDKENWAESAQIPPRCSMAYMLPDGDYLEQSSWKYQDYYLKNPGEDGFEYSNNHTHLQKYEGKWYVFNHTMSLKSARGIKGGYRNIAVDEIDVDEDTQKISLAHATNQGVTQIRTVNPYQTQQMEMTFATDGVSFIEDKDLPGNMFAKSDSTGAIKVKGVEFSKRTRKITFNAIGQGQIDVHLDNPDGELIASTFIDGVTTCSIISAPKGINDLVFILKGDGLLVDSWTMR